MGPTLPYRATVMLWARAEEKAWTMHLGWNQTSKASPLAILFSWQRGCATPQAFPSSKWSSEPGNQDKSTTHSSGLDDSDSTSHRLLLCVFECVCTGGARALPMREAVSCVRACVCVCTYMCMYARGQALEDSPELGPSALVFPKPEPSACSD